LPLRILLIDRDSKIVAENLASKPTQNSPFQSGRFEFGWAGLRSDGRLVVSGKGCCVVRRFLAGRSAA
jgi:hypothetical protein